MDLETLLYEVRDGVAHITLNREKAANALNLQMCADLEAAALAAQEDAAVRAVLIGARGKMFCAGGDLGAMGEAGDGAPSYRALLVETTSSACPSCGRLA